MLAQKGMYIIRICAGFKKKGPCTTGACHDSASPFAGIAAIGRNTSLEQGQKPKASIRPRHDFQEAERNLFVLLTPHCRRDRGDTNRPHDKEDNIQEVRYIDPKTQDWLPKGNGDHVPIPK